MENLPNMMKRWTTLHAGPPSRVLRLDPSVPLPPAPRAGEIMVKVSAVALNPGDIKMMAMYLPFRGNFVSGMDFVGKVVHTSPPFTSSNSHVEVGMIVAGTLPMFQGAFGGQGTLQEYIVLPAHVVAEVPEGMRNAPQAAGLFGVVGQTTATLLRAAQLKSGARVLVNGASGGVGSVLVQVLTGMGIHVTAICSGKNEEMVRRVGADEVVDYKVYGSGLYDHLKAFTERVSQGPFDAIFDLVGDAKLYHSSPSYLRPSGKYLDIEAGPFGWLKLDNWRPVFLGGTPRTFVPVFSYPSGASAREAASWDEKGWVKEVVTDSVIGFGDAVKAFERLATGRAVGKVLITMG